MLLPVHAPFEGLVIVTVGGVVSPPLLLCTVTVMLFVLVIPLALTVAASVWAPSGTLVESQLKVAVWLVVPVRLPAGDPSAVRPKSRVEQASPLVMVTGTVPWTVAPFAGVVIVAEGLARVRVRLAEAIAPA